MPNGFNAGDLNLSISAIADDTLKKLDILTERLSFIEGSLKHISGTSRNIGKSSRGKGKTEQNYGFGKNLLSIGKWTAVIAASRKLGRFMGNIVQAGSDYTETLNLWQVAMRNNLDTADQFVNKMQKAYGISTKTLMNAQAIFKNMVGNLGNVSDATAYALSEALVQMSVDFSSLYNVKLNEAFNKMQAMLARQVRPIRSVSGYDITENTIYELYQSLGGTKAMRQLNNTEKQLLSIYAVLKQMGASGALGDMTKTLNQFANQARMMTEYFAELKAWSGLLLKDLIDDWGLLVKINAVLITITEVVKAFAKARGLGKENFIDGMFESAEATNDEIDELQGKLLDFDKFRSLEGESSTPLAIDEKLLEALTGYSSKIDGAKNKAKELAETWLQILGFTKDADGNLVTTDENLENIENKFKSILGIVSAISAGIFGVKTFKNSWVGAILALFAYGYTTNERFRESINKLVVSLSNSLIPIIDIIIDTLSVILSAATPLIDILSKVIVFANEIGVLEPLLHSVIVGFLTFKGLQLIEHFDKMSQTFGNFLKKMIELPNATNKSLSPLNKQKISFENVAVAIGAMVAAYSLSYSFIDQFDGKTRTIVSSLFILVGAITAATAAWAAFHSTMSLGTALPVILAGAGAAIAGIQGLMPKVQVAAVGASNLDSGTLFLAGEMGKTEAVYTGSNGKTNVANVKQMRLAFLGALQDWTNDYLDNELEELAEITAGSASALTSGVVYAAVKSEAKRRGEKFSKA